MLFYKSYNCFKLVHFYANLEGEGVLAILLPNMAEDQSQKTMKKGASMREH